MHITKDIEIMIEITAVYSNREMLVIENYFEMKNGIGLQIIFLDCVQSFSFHEQYEK